jgi:hypothetical protein
MLAKLNTIYYMRFLRISTKTATAQFKKNQKFRNYERNVQLAFFSRPSSLSNASIFSDIIKLRKNRRKMTGLSSQWFAHALQVCPEV